MRLHVAVEDPLLVRVQRFQRAREALRDRDRLRRLERPARDPPDERLAVEELHGHVEDGLPLERRLVHLVAADDVRVLDGLQHRGLAQEDAAQLARALVVDALEHDLQGDEAPVGGVPGAVDLAHAAFAEDAVDLVEPDPRPRRIGRWGRGRRRRGLLRRRRRHALAARGLQGLDRIAARHGASSRTSTRRSAASAPPPWPGSMIARRAENF